MTERLLGKVAEATRGPRKPLAGEGEIGIAAGKPLAKTGMGKYSLLRIEEGALAWERRQALIAEADALDGSYVILTKVPVEKMSTKQTRKANQSLSKVERAFRNIKDVELQIRPMHHGLEDRVGAHVFPCILA